MLRSRGGCGGDHPGLHRRGDEPGARPKRGDLRLGGELPQPLGIGLAVVEHDRGARQQPADQEVPHHPAGGGEPEEAVAGSKIAVETRLLQVLQQDAALTLDDRLRQAGRAGRVEDPERVVERQALEARARRARRAARPSRSAPAPCARSMGSRRRSLPRARGGRSRARRIGSPLWRSGPSARSA